MIDNQQEKSFSLQDEIKKRKTVEIARAVETKQLEAIRGEGEQVPTKITTPSPAQRQAAQFAPIQKPVTEYVSPIQTTKRKLSFRQKRFIIGAMAGLAIMLVCSLVVLVAPGNPQPAQAAVEVMPPLPLKDALQVVDYLKSVGMNVTNVQELTGDQSWQVNHILEVEATADSNTGRFLLLTYDSQNKAVADTFRIRNSEQYGKWTLRNMSNVNLLVSPESPVEIRQILLSHLLSYIVAPYRSFLPTPTPRVTTNPVP